MKTVLISLSIILVALVALYTWFNRDLDRVVLTFVSVLTLGAFGFIAKESISNKPEEYSKTIPIVVLYEKPSYRPLNISFPYTFDLGYALQNIPQTMFPKEEESIDIGFASDVYFEAMLYVILKKVAFIHAHGWELNHKVIHNPMYKTVNYGSKSDEGDLHEFGEFLSLVPNKYGIHDVLDLPKSFGGQFKLPPSMTINAVESDSTKGFEMLLSNRYVSLKISFISNGSSAGIGDYVKLADLDDAYSQIGGPAGNSSYSLEISAKQNWWLNGHPEMKKYKLWIESLISILDSEFNYELIRQRHIEQYQIFGTSAIRFIPDKART